MQNRRHGPLEGIGDHLQVVKVERAFGELIVLQPLLDEPVDHRPDAALGGFGKRPGGRFYRVGEHQHGGLFGLRARPGVAKVQLFDGIGALECAFIKVRQNGSPVVFVDKRLQSFRQAVFAEQVYAVSDVTGDNQVRQVR